MATVSSGRRAALLPFARIAGLPRSALRRRLSLAQQFALVCLGVLFCGAFVIGSWVAREIERGVIERTAAVTALYVDSVVSPHLKGLESGYLSEAEMEALSTLLQNTTLGEKIVSFKVWSTEGEVLFGRDRALIGQRFAIEDDLRKAIEGSVGSHLSTLDSEENRFERQHWSRLVETYAPVRAEDGRVIGVVEFYQLPGDLQRQVDDSRRKSWAIVAASTFLMYLVLVGLVGGASATITRQNRNLRAAFEEQKALQGQVRRLNQRLRTAASAKAQTDEELLRRVAQDLHDGPAQGVALGLLRLEAMDRDGASDDERAALESIRFSLARALADLRSVSTTLRLPQIEGLGWRQVVEKAVVEHRQRTGSVVRLQVQDIPLEPTNSQRIAAYRVVQEALSNAARHSGEAEQRVSLSWDGSQCLLTIEDRGVGFEPENRDGRGERRAGLGLQGMRERVELLGGSLEVRSRRGAGTRVVARIPVEKVDAIVESESHE